MSNYSFEYWLSLNGNRALDNTEHKISKIVFDITRYSEAEAVIDFGTRKVTELEAVNEVQNYLSQPITLDYYNIVKEVMEDSGIYSFEEFINRFKHRSELLGSAIFLEDVARSKSDPDKYFIVTGS
jgi:hypothetical protein